MSDGGKSSKARLTFVDAAKGIGMLMIMYGHITDLSNPVDTWMSSFKVTIFYVVTGFLLAYSQSVAKRSFREYARGVLRSQLIPYVLFSALGIVFKVGCSILKHKERAKVMASLITLVEDAIFLKGINSLWFIPTSIIGALVFYLLFQAPLPMKVAYAGVGPFFVTAFRLAAERCSVFSDMGMDLCYQASWRLCWALGKGLMAAWFIGAGYLVYRAYDSAFGEGRRGEKLLRAVVAVALCCLNLVLAAMNEGVDINQLSEGVRPYLFYVCGILGSTGTILVCVALSEYISLKALEYIGKNSLIIMATHTVFGLKTIAYRGWKAVAYIPEEANLEYLCECVLVLCVLLLLQYAVIELINNRLPFLLGKRAMVEPKHQTRS